MKKKIMMILTGKRPLIDVWHYFIGNYRYWLYIDAPRSIRNLLMRYHIWQQITWRIQIMDQECYNNGSCKVCGCETPALQMAAKSCDGNCYPPFMSKRKWIAFRNGNAVVTDNNGCEVWCVSKLTGRPDKFVWDEKTKSYNQIVVSNV